MNNKLIIILFRILIQSIIRSKFLYFHRLIFFWSHHKGEGEREGLTTLGYISTIDRGGKLWATRNIDWVDYRILFHYDILNVPNQYFRYGVNGWGILWVETLRLGKYNLISTIRHYFRFDRGRPLVHLSETLVSFSLHLSFGRRRVRGTGTTTSRLVTDRVTLMDSLEIDLYDLTR